MKSRLSEYVHAKCDVDTRKKPHVLRCPSPDHTDNNPSAVLYDERVYCPVCSQNWDIYDVAGMINGTSEFKDQKKILEDFFGVSKTEHKTEKKKHDHKKSSPVAVSPEAAKRIYTHEKINEFAEFFKFVNPKFVKLWAYKNEQGEIDAIDVRYEHDDKKGNRDKSVITLWYDGKHVKAKHPPIVLYNRDKLSKDKTSPVLIVEGAKSAEAAEKINGFVVTTWNGGGKKYDKVDWSILKDREVYIYPDDDAPGMVTGSGIRKILRELNCKVELAQPLPEAKTIKKKGADI
ncbi:MAG: hypothetical protein OEV64_13535, partial [Desulfobulbaceae bacterium]|nr:hypothetical protein [Desulfobulbaceae bacterium]